MMMKKMFVTTESTVGPRLRKTESDPLGPNQPHLGLGDHYLPKQLPLSFSPELKHRQFHRRGLLPPELIQLHSPPPLLPPRLLPLLLLLLLLNDLR